MRLCDVTMECTGKDQTWAWDDNPHSQNPASLLNTPECSSSKSERKQEDTEFTPLIVRVQTHPSLILSKTLVQVKWKKQIHGNLTETPKAVTHIHESWGKKYMEECIITAWVFWHYMETMT